MDGITLPDRLVRNRPFVGDIQQGSHVYLTFFVLILTEMSHF